MQGLIECFHEHRFHLFVRELLVKDLRRPAETFQRREINKRVALGDDLVLLVDKYNLLVVGASE